VNIPKKIYKSWQIEANEIVSPDSSPEEKKKDSESGSSSASDNEENTEAPVDVQENNLSSILSDFHLQERGLFQDINLYKLFKGQRMPSLWKLWELVLTNQPVMVMSESPAESR